MKRILIVCVLLTALAVPSFGTSREGRILANGITKGKTEIVVHTSKTPDRVLADAYKDNGKGQMGDYVSRALSGIGYGKRGDKIVFHPRYYETPKQKKKVSRKLRTLRKRFAGTRYQKVKKIYRYISKTKYKSTRITHKTPYSVLIKRKGDCMGQSIAFYLLCRQARIPCRIVSGFAVDGTPHAWNLVKLNGRWYNVDATWGGKRNFLKGAKFKNHKLSKKYKKIKITKKDYREKGDFNG